MTKTYETYNGIHVELDEDRIRLTPRNGIGKALLTSAESVGAMAGGEGKPKSSNINFPLSEVVFSDYRPAKRLTNGHIKAKLPDRAMPVSLIFRRKDADKLVELATQLGVPVG